MSPLAPGGDLRAGAVGHPGPGYDEAMTAANQVRYGLSSSIYTRDVNTAFRAMRDLETGIVYVNAGHHRRRDAPAVRGPKRRPATATARRATSRSTRSPSGSRSTWTSAAGSSGPRSTTSRRDVTDAASSPARIRATTPEDAGRIADIYVAMARHHAVLDPAEYRVPEHAAVVTRFRTELEAADEVDLHLVAEVDGVVVGQLDAFMRPLPSAGSMRMPRRGALIGIAVDEDWRGRGIGTALMHAAEAWARTAASTRSSSMSRTPTATRDACTSGWATASSRTRW